MRLDRLSCFTDDILIEIISRLPLQLSITTETLSRRWRGLWTNATSIDLSTTFKLCKTYTPLNSTMRQITSPSIHRFIIEFLESHFDLNYWAPCLDIIIRAVCNRNVHQFKVTWCNPFSWHTLPSVIFQTQSLVSIELGSKSGSSCYSPDCDTINLPNLKNLTIHFGQEYQWIEKLVKACPSLEKLSLYCLVSNDHYYYSQSGTIVIYAPNLEYLSVYAPKIMVFSFKEKPIMLRKTKIECTDLRQAQSNKDQSSKFYEAISNVRILSFDISAVDGLSTVFRNVTRLTFNMNLSFCLDTLVSVLELFPVVDVLNLKFCGVDDNKKQLLYGKPGNVSTSRQAIKRIKSINVEIENRITYRNCPKSFSRLIMGLLGSACDLEHLNLSVNDCQERLLSNVMRNQEQELILCKKLYRCKTISTCDVVFNGRFLKMSRKDGPKVTTANGKVIDISGW